MLLHLSLFFRLCCLAACGWCPTWMPAVLTEKALGVINTWALERDTQMIHLRWKYEVRREADSEVSPKGWQPLGYSNCYQENLHKRQPKKEAGKARSCAENDVKHHKQYLC